jgi:hypothetical protein
MSQFPPGDSVPYASYLPPQKLRPTSVTAIATLAIIFGSFGLLGLLCTVPRDVREVLTGHPASTRLTLTPQAQQEWKDYYRNPMFISWKVFSTLSWLVLSIIELWAGISLLSLKPAARRWIIRFAIADLVIGILTLIVAIIIIQPRVPHLTPLHAGSTANMRVIVQVFTDIITVIVLAWPISILHFMSRPHVKDAFERAADAQ